MSADRKCGATGHANTRPATDAPPAARSRPTSPEKRFRVETLKRETGLYQVYQAYDDKALAEKVAGQLAWVGATVRIVRA